MSNDLLDRMRTFADDDLFVPEARVTSLVAAAGRSALDRSHQAQRLAREATFTLVAPSRPAMRQTLVERFATG